MANFKIPQDGVDISSFDLPKGRTVTLLQWGGDREGNTLDVGLDRSTSAVTLAVLPGKQAAASTAFTLTGHTTPAQVKVTATVKSTGQKYSGDLTVNVMGEPTRHPGFDVDLIADLAMKGGAKQIRLYSKVMTDPDDLLRQNMKEGEYNCGDVSAAYGVKLFGKKTNLDYFQYYLTPTNSTMADLRFDPRRMRSAIEKIKSLLTQGISVRVWLIHDDGFKKQIDRHDPTHFVTIVGFGGNKFLYVDPWEGGSRLTYQGGMYPARAHPYLGLFEFDLGALELGIRSSAVSRGSMPYTVVAGP